ncbi:MAG: helix-turn-helix transcriptional regulator [Clostridia bacterium]|nr:helix-turn-helix transcriptional regulator [Clostridia bacterium]
MNDLEYISLFEMRELCFDTTYTTGSLQSYSRPCIGYLKRGMGKFFCNGNTYFAHEGDLIYIAKDTKYYSIWYGDPEIDFYSISFDFAHPYAYYNYRFQIVQGYPARHFDGMFESIKKEPLTALSHMYALLADLYPRMQTEQVSVQSGAIEQAVIHIENHYTEPLEINELCKKCHLSRSSLFDAFKKRTGVSPIHYKHNVMIQHALDMLSHTDLTVDEISQRVGFSSSNYFRTVFTKMTGKTPKEVRKKGE